MAIEDYGAFIKSGMGLVPNFADQIAEKLKLNIEQQQADTQRLAAQSQAAEVAQKLGRAQMFQKDLAGVQSDPSPQNVSGLIMKYPEFGEQVKSGWDVKDKAAKDADLTQLGEVYSAAASGNWQLAGKQAQARVDAEKAAGTADDGDQAMLDQINAAAGGDGKAQKNVLAALGTHIAAISGPEHFASVFGALKGGYTLDEGAARFDDNGNMTAHSPFIKDANGNIRLWNDDGSGQPPPQDGAPTSSTPAQAGGFDNAVAHVLKHEGSAYVPHDMNGAPVKFGINQGANPNVDVKNLTEDQAKQIYHDKYWVPSGAENMPPNLQAPYFDVYIRNPKVAQSALQRSGGDPAKFMQLSSAYFQNLAKGKGAAYAKSWANRDAENTAIATGQASPDVAAPAHSAAVASTERFPVVIAGASPDQYRTLTPEEVTKRGLDATQQYQLNTKTGQITGLGKGNSSAPPPGNADLSGPEYLADLRKKNPSLAAQAQGVLDTRLAYPPATARSPQAQQLRAAVLQIDPSYDEQAYARRKTTVQQYTPGHSGPGQSMLSAATIINHMYDLAQAARNLPDHSTAAQNAVSSWFAKQTNEPWLIKYNEGRKFVASELPKFLEGKAPTEGQVHEHYDSYSPSKGKSGIQTALATDVDYLVGRYQPLIQAYKDNTGKDLNIDDYAPGQLTRAKSAALEYYRTNGALPVVVSSAAQAAKLPHGSVFATPDGRVLRRH